MVNASKENYARTGKKPQGTANSETSATTHTVMKNLKSMTGFTKTKSDNKAYTPNRIVRSSIRRNIAPLAPDAPLDTNTDPSRRFTDIIGSHSSKVLKSD